MAKNKKNWISGMKYLSILGIILVAQFTLYNSEELDKSETEFFDPVSLDEPNLSNGDELKKVIVSFNHSSYSGEILTNFFNYNGIVTKQFNNSFSKISMFFGMIPQENITLFEQACPDATVENDEVVDTYMNYATIQTIANDSIWDYPTYNGATNASIAVLDSGINADHPFFPDGYNETNLEGNVIDWENFVDSADLSDDNGHGTYISSIIAGSGKKGDKINLQIDKNYTIEDPSPGNYTKKIATINIDTINSSLFINSTREIIGNDLINNFWVEVYQNETFIKRTSNILDNQYESFNYTIPSEGLGLYDIFIVLNKDQNKQPSFNFNSQLQFQPEQSLSQVNHLSGLANGTKIASYKVVNQSGLGHVSDVIKALNRTIANKKEKHIISVCLSIGTLGEEIMAFSSVIDEVINNGTMVIIAAGNNGINPDKLNQLALNKNAIVVGAINDKDQVTSYSNMGQEIGGGVIKPDLVAPGGSKLAQHRTIIGADGQSNQTTGAFGTSISAALVSAATNVLVQAKWSNWSEWKNLNLTKWVKTIKSILLMTASETNLDREEDPATSTSESSYSPSLSNAPLSDGITDIHEGYGRMNLQAAVNALTQYMDVNKSTSGYLESSINNPSGKHSFARRIILESNKTYLFNLTGISNAEMDMFLFSNESNKYGEPILLQSMRTQFDPTASSFYFSPEKDQTENIVVIKAREGASSFNLKITNTTNIYAPQLDEPEISYTGGIKNTTVLSIRESQGYTIDKNYTIDSYQFFIKYTDNDTTNAPPQEIYMVIENRGNYTLELDPTRNIFPANYSQGMIYWSEEITFGVAGTYNYYFIAEDGAFSARYPEIGNLEINIESPESKEIPYRHSFNDGFPDGWYETEPSTEAGWGLLQQLNINDNRARLHDVTWNSYYFGQYHFYPQNYTYQPLVPTGNFPNGSLITPFFNLTGLGQEFNPVAKLGIRTSINDFDNIRVYISANWSTEEEIRTYTNTEEEWDMDIINLTEYKDTYVQFRFEADLDDLFDQIQYKGFMLDYFAIENYTNNYEPVLEDNLPDFVDATEGSRYRKFNFNCEYFDDDNNYPEFVYLEIDNNNYSMLNIYGDWTANSTEGGEEGNYGIKFQKQLRIGDISNRSFRFHISDGKTVKSSGWFNKENSLITLTDPSPLELNTFTANGQKIGYKFDHTEMDEFYVTGIPVPSETTAWLSSYNTWHPMSSLTYGEVIYGGEGQYSLQITQYDGYGENWNANLITRPVKIGEEHTPYLIFTHNFSMDGELLYEQFGGTDIDKFRVSISDDFGSSWNVLTEYTYDLADPTKPASIDLSDYEDSTVMIKFTMDTNNYPGIGRGWFLKDIYVGFKENADYVAPSIKILSPAHKETVSSDVEIKVELSDNIGIDGDRVQIYINDESVSTDKFEYNEETGVLTYNWDTWQHDDGIYDITIVAFDEEGNRVEKTITVEIDNGFVDFYKWGPWIIGILIAVIVGIVMYIIAERRGKSWINRIKNYNAEKKRLDQIDRDQAIKRIEILEKEEELERPLTLHCKFCKSWFLNDDFDMICPNCGHDQVYAAYNCVNCGEWYLKDEPSLEYMCPNKKCEGVRLIRRSQEDVRETLAEEGLFPQEFEKKKKDDKYSILD